MNVTGVKPTNGPGHPDATGETRTESRGTGAPTIRDRKHTQGYWGFDHSRVHRGSCGPRVSRWRSASAVGLGFAAIVFGALGTMGWIFKIPILASILPGAVAMRWPTSIALAVCGAAIVAERMGRLVVTGMLALCGLFIMGGLLFRYTAPAVEPVGPYGALDPQMASVATIMCISLFAGAMIYRTWATALEVRCTASRFSGWAILLISGLALAGYAVQIPWLFWYMPPHSTAIAFPTALASFALGLALLILPSTKPA